MMEIRYQKPPPDWAFIGFNSVLGTALVIYGLVWWAV